MEGLRRWRRGRLQPPGGPGGGPVGRAGRRSGVAVPGCIRMSLRAMKSAHEPVVVGLSGMVQERPGTGLAGMDPAEICINMQEICRTTPEICNYLPKICNYMSEICIKYAQYIDCISHIWKKYALNMPGICTNMQTICSYMLKICSYMPKICNKYAQYIDCISRICKKYAVKIFRNIQFYMQNMHKSIYCIYCIYMHSPLC